jgi:hypothetical protein
MRWRRWIGGTIRSLFRKAELDRELDAGRGLGVRLRPGKADLV